jgi:hypothetical protein
MKEMYLKVILENDTGCLGCPAEVLSYSGIEGTIHWCRAAQKASENGLRLPDCPLVEKEAIYRDG